MNLHETAAHVLATRRAADAAESAHADLIAAEVRASVPGPWVAVAGVGATVEQGAVVVGLAWHPDRVFAWTAWASAPGDGWHRSVKGTTPRLALDALRLNLGRCRHGANGRASLALVVRLLRGWA
jgi:hypothetical protein